MITNGPLRDGNCAKTVFQAYSACHSFGMERAMATGLGDRLQKWGLYPQLFTERESDVRKSFGSVSK